ncbi:MAG: hypothetical protein JWO89_1128 [Verrucomicrobiaceae bacterium]|nr:hypothetical protein [Verrucomicrobiaceae bacterium]
MAAPPAVPAATVPVSHLRVSRREMEGGLMGEVIRAVIPVTMTTKATCGNPFQPSIRHTKPPNFGRPESIRQHLGAMQHLMPYFN